MAYDPQTYWPDRYRRQGPSYVAPGGRPGAVHPQAEAAKPFLREFLAGDSVLDFGCGPQRFRPVIEEGGREYQGVDLIPGLGTMDGTRGLPAERFDSAVALWVLQHIVDHAEYSWAVGQLWATLRPGGRLLVIDHNPRPKMDPHMGPRGWAALFEAAPWENVQIVGEIDGHWVGVFVKPSHPVTFDPPRKEAVLPPVSVVPVDAPGKAMILGGAECVWEDMAALEALNGGPWDGIVVAVNDVACHYPGRIDHWATLHPEKLPKWQQERREKGLPGEPLTWSRHKKPMVAKLVHGWAGGSSGLLAVSVAVELGVQRIVLCGVPMERTPHFKESTVHQRGKAWSSAPSHLKAWQIPANLDRIRGIVKSMSGKTRELLGEPTREWLEGSE